MVNRLTHDIRNPMTIISGSLEILEENPDQETSESMMKMIKSANKKIHGLIDEFFVLEDREETTYNPEEFRPIEEANRISQAFISIFNSKKQLFSINLKRPSECKIKASKMDFYRIITNLLSNAHYHTKNKTKIEIYSLIKKESVEIIVKDWGEGIAPEEVDELFTRKAIAYKDSLDKNGRLGIGLYSVNLLVSRNNGSISYEHNKEGGAILKISFPISSYSKALPGRSKNYNIN